MALILWTTEYSVGVDSLDADHITLFSLINHIDDSHLSGEDQAAITPIMTVLKDKAVEHFRREETVMQERGYPDLAAHKAEHEEIMSELESLYEAYRASPSPDLSREIVEILADWLENHVLKSDMRYRPFMADTGAGSAEGDATAPGWPGA